VVATGIADEGIREMERPFHYPRRTTFSREEVRTVRRGGAAPKRVVKMGTIDDISGAFHPASSSGGKAAERHQEPSSLGPSEEEVYDVPTFLRNRAE
jgi:hypothetical protein